MVLRYTDKYSKPNKRNDEQTSLIQTDLNEYINNSLY